MIQLNLKTLQKPIFAFNQLDTPIKVAGVASIAIAAIGVIVAMSSGATSTKTLTPSSVVENTAPSIESKSSKADTAKQTLVLKSSTTLASANFAVKSITISDSDKKSIATFVSDSSANGYIKMHLKGFSGDDSTSYNARRDFAMGRAFAVKTQLVNEHHVEPSKIRVFFRAGDVSETAKVQMTSFTTAQEAQNDAANFFAFKLIKK
jgi:hypothetical protein